MKSRDFCYWLQGFVELVEAGNEPGVIPAEVTRKQWAVIRNHLTLVFKHEIDPEAGDAKVQEALNALHSGKDRPQIGGTHPQHDDILIRC